MADLPIQFGTYNRRVAQAPYIALKNRFFEKNPVLSDSQVSAIARPGLKKFAEVGSGHIRAVFSELGVFDDALFVVSDTILYKLSTTLTQTTIGQIDENPLNSPSFATVAPIGEVPAKLFIASGGVLWVYNENGQALGHLQVTGSIANTDLVRVDNTYYSFTTGSVDTGTPDGTSGNPWLVALGSGNATAFNNLYNAVNATGTPGTDYSTVLTIHPTCYANNVSGSDLYVSYNDYGTAGNSIATTVTSATLSWGAATLQNGGASQFRQVLVPDDAGAISVASINSYVIVIPVQTEDINGRFYWIRPGEMKIDPRDFATAERSPDPIHQVKVYGDMFWLLGGKTSEPWVVTGSAEAPVQRFTGILFDRGTWEGTAVQVKDSLIMVDEDGGVFQMSGGQKRISRPDIEERIRLAIQSQAMLSL